MRDPGAGVGLVEDVLPRLVEVGLALGVAGQQALVEVAQVAHRVLPLQHFQQVVVLGDDQRVVAVAASVAGLRSSLMMFMPEPLRFLAAAEPAQADP